MTDQHPADEVARDRLPRDRREDVSVVERPWGRFEQFTLNEPTTVKTITVEPGHRLSLQRHEHRRRLLGERGSDRGGVDAAVAVDGQGSGAGVDGIRLVEQDLAVHRRRDDA